MAPFSPDDFPRGVAHGEAVFEDSLPADGAQPGPICQYSWHPGHFQLARQSVVGWMGKLGPRAGGASPESQQRNTDGETGPVGLSQVPDILQGRGSRPPAGHLVSHWPVKAKKPGFLQKASAGKEGPGAPLGAPPTFSPHPLPALLPAGHSPPSHIQKHLPSRLRGKVSSMLSRAAEGFCSENQPSGDFSETMSQHLVL